MIKLHDYFSELNRRLNTLEMTLKRNKDSLKSNVPDADRITNNSRSLHHSEKSIVSSDSFHNVLFLGCTSSENSNLKETFHETDTHPSEEQEESNDIHTFDSKRSKGDLANVKYDSDDCSENESNLSDHCTYHEQEDRETSAVVSSHEFVKDGFGFKRKLTEFDADNRSVVHHELSSRPVPADMRISKLVDATDANIRVSKTESVKSKEVGRYTLSF